MHVTINDLWVVIPTYNRVDDLLACLASLLEAGILQNQIVVVDNYSQDDTVEQMRHLYPEVHLITLDENIGAARASNHGFDYVLKQGAELVLRLDSDTVVDKAFTLPLLKAVEENPQAGVLSPKIYYFNPPDEIWFAGISQHKWHFGGIKGHRHKKDALDNSRLRETDYTWGAAMLIKREVLHETGGFDPDFFIYYEEVDFCLRVKELGYKLLFVPDSFVWHKVGSSASNDWTAYHWNLSKATLYKKHARNNFHFFSLKMYAYLYSIMDYSLNQIDLRKYSRNRGPLKSALKGLREGFKNNTGRKINNS